jgi:hypothetical protein
MRGTPVNRLFASILFLPAALWAADVWESKPFADWTDKDLQKVVNNSPWARQTRATLANAAAGGRGRGGAQAGLGDEASGDASISGGAGGRGSRGGGSAGGADRLGPSPSDFDQGPQAAQQAGIPVIIRWQSALPLRQAQMRGKYGKEAATAPEAQKFLATEPTVYVVAVSGLPGSIVSGSAGDQAKQNITRSTTLTAKGKEPVHPVAVEFVPNGTAVDVLMGFPRNAPFALEDMEAELTSQIGPASVKYKFKLKDMVVRGKLEL